MKTQLNRIHLVETLMVFIAFVFIFNSCNTKKDQASNEEIEKTILSLEKKALDNWAKGDPIRFSDNFSEDATYFDDIGAYQRLDSIDEINNYFQSLDGKIPHHKYKLEDQKVQIYDDVAILTLWYRSSTLDNEPGALWKASSVYRLIDGEWKVVHANWSLVKEDNKSEEY